jgi:tripartite-type tricarboxylate transporter receptor subunit TctC
MQTPVRLRRRDALAVLAGLPLAARAQQAAKAWPSRPLTIIVPSAAGGAADFVGRSFAQYLGTVLPGESAIVENQAGAGGIIGTLATKAAPADGHTFMVSTNSTHAANVSLYRNLRYDPLTDFAQVGLFGTYASVLVAHRDAPYRSLAQFIDFARAHPGRLNYGYYSSSSQVPAELLRTRANLRFSGAAYKAITQMLTDLMGGQLDFVFVDMLSAAPALQNDRLVALAVTSGRALPSLAQVPPVASALPGYEVQGWFGLSARAGTPPEVVARMARLVRGALEDAAFRRALEARGLTTRSLTGPAFERFVAEDVDRWAEWIRLAGIERQ